MYNNKTLCLALAIAGTCLLHACSPKVSKPVADSGTKAPAETTAAGTDVHYSKAQLAQGHTIYTDNCGKCHKLFKPEDKSLARWEKMLPPMIRKAKLSDEQGTLVRAWVMSNLK